MSETTKSELKNQIVRHLYDRISKQGMDREASSSAIRRAIQATVSTNYLEVLIDSLINENLVREGSRSKRYSITEDGIDFVENGKKLFDNHFQISDNWNEPDQALVLTVSVSETVKMHLGQCLTLIAASNFTQEEKAQIAGLIRICQQIVELPTPKLGLLKRILGWLKEVKELIPLIEAILKMIGKA